MVVIGIGRMKEALDDEEEEAAVWVAIIIMEAMSTPLKGVARKT